MAGCPAAFVLAVALSLSALTYGSTSASEPRVILDADLGDAGAVRILSPDAVGVARPAGASPFIHVDAAEPADVCLIPGAVPAGAQRWIAVTLRSVDPGGWTNRVRLALRPRGGADVDGPLWTAEPGAVHTVHWLVRVTRDSDLLIRAEEPCAFDVLRVLIREPTGIASAGGVAVKNRGAVPDPEVARLDALRREQGLDEILLDMTVILCDEGGGEKVRSRVGEIMADFRPDFVDWSPISGASLAGEYGVRQSRGAWEYEEYYRSEGPEVWDRRYELFGNSGFCRSLWNTMGQTTVWASGGHLTFHNGDNWHEAWLDSVWTDVFPRCEGFCQDNIGVCLFHNDFCFCPGCYEKFGSYLLEAYSPGELRAMGVPRVEELDVRERILSSGLSGEAALADPVVREYIKFQNVSHLRNWRDAVVRVKARAAAEGRLMPVTGNQIGADGYNAPAVAVSQYNDVVEIEALLGVGERVERTLMHARVGRAAAGQKPVWIRGPVRDALSPDDAAMLSGTYWRVYLGEQAANGALRDFSFGMNAPWTGDPAREEFIDSPAVMDAYREMAGFLRRWRPLFTRRRSLARVGLIYSMPSYIWRGFGSLDLFVWPLQNRNVDLLTRMDARHVPADVVIFGHPEMWDDRETLASLGRYRVLVAGPADCVSDAQLGALRRYVDGGGVLLCFEGDFGTRDENFNPRVAGPGLPAEAVFLPELPSNADEMLGRLAGISPDAPSTLSLQPWLILDGRGVAVHMVNYDVDPREETVRSSPHVTLRLPVPEKVWADGGVLLAPGAEPMALAPRIEALPGGRMLTCAIPPISTYAVAVFSRPGELEAAGRAAEGRRREDRENVRKWAESVGR